MKEYGLSEYDANVLVNDRAMADYYEEVCKHTKMRRRYVTGLQEMLVLI